jgi:hypothetical protein
MQNITQRLGSEVLTLIGFSYGLAALLVGVLLSAAWIASSTS